MEGDLVALGKTDHRVKQRRAELLFIGS
jgi:hypothetical protein